MAKRGFVSRIWECYLEELYPSIYLSILISIYQSIHLSIYLFIYLSMEHDHLPLTHLQSKSVAISLQCYQTLLSTQLWSHSFAIKQCLGSWSVGSARFWLPESGSAKICVRAPYLSVYISIYLTRCQLLDIYIPVLVNLLQTEEAGISSKSRHEMALMRLTRVGAQYPADFKVH